MGDAEYLGGFGLGPCFVADQDFQLAHEVGAHREDGCLVRWKAEIDKYVAGGFGDF